MTQVLPTCGKPLEQIFVRHVIGEASGLRSRFAQIGGSLEQIIRSSCLITKGSTGKLFSCLRVPDSSASPSLTIPSVMVRSYSLFFALTLTLGALLVRADDIQRYLDAHNSVRAQHGATALTWNATSAGLAQTWADKCQFEHSGGSLGPLGGTSFYISSVSRLIQSSVENLAAGYGGGYDIEPAIKSWTDEVCECLHQ